MELLGWARDPRASLGSLLGTTASVPRNHLVSNDLHAIKHEQVRTVDRGLIGDVIPFKKST